MSRHEHSRDAILAQAFGPLEVRVLEAMWEFGRPATVRDLHSSFPQLAYTTLMTTLDRLHKKDVLCRSKVGRAYAYDPRFERAEMEMRIAARNIDDLIGSAPGHRTLAPLLSCFVDAVTERDRLLLDELEQLLHEKRSQLDRKDP